MRAVLAIISREFADILRNRMLLISSLIPSLIFLMLPFVISNGNISENRKGGQMSPDQMQQVLVQTEPALAGLPGKALVQIFMFRQFVAFLLSIPIITSISIATYSIIGEKQTRSLEPLLATPITSAQLMLAKSLAAAGPATALTWIVFALYMLIIRFAALPHVVTHVITPVTLMLIFVICPLVATFGLSVGVIVSSRANDPRTAQQIGGLFILPILTLFVAQMAGFFFLRVSAVVISTIILLALDIGVLAAGVALFDRETILVRWK